MLVVRNIGFEPGVLRDTVGLIERHKAAIACLKTGETCETHDAHVSALGVERNIVLEIRWRHWSVPLIAKYAREDNPFPQITAWEIRQWELVNGVLDGAAGAVVPSLIAFDEAREVLLLGKLDGVSVLRILKLAPIYGLYGSKRAEILAGFYSVGRLLGLLHRRLVAETRSRMFYSIGEKLLSLSMSSRSDEVFSRGLSVWTRNGEVQEPKTWVHGNLRTDNVLFWQGQASLIDLENAGAGSPMEDLGRFIAYIAIWRMIPVFSRKLSQDMISHTIEGYGSESPWSAQLLSWAILGEILYVYGRDYSGKRISLPRRVLGHGIRRLVSYYTGLVEQAAKGIVLDARQFAG